MLYGGESAEEYQSENVSDRIFCVSSRILFIYTGGGKQLPVHL